MIEKKIIQELEKQKSNYTSPESAQDQANSLDSLSSDIYTDSKRFIYELIQNADDASSNSGKLDISLKIANDYLIVSPGIQIDWDKVEGLREAMGKDGVCSNYSYESVDSTWNSIQNMVTYLAQLRFYL